MVLPLEKPGQRGAERDRRHRPGFGQHIGAVRGHARAQQQWLQALAYPQQKHQDRAAHGQAQPMNCRHVLGQTQHQGDKVLTMGADAQHGFKLTGCNQQTGSGNETGDHWMAQKISEKTQSQHTH